MRFSTAALLVVLSAATSGFAKVSMSKSGGDGEYFPHSSPPSRHPCSHPRSCSHLLHPRRRILRSHQLSVRHDRRRRSRDDHELPWCGCEPQQVRTSTGRCRAQPAPSFLSFVHAILTSRALQKPHVRPQDARIQGQEVCYRHGRRHLPRLRGRLCRPVPSSVQEARAAQCRPPPWHQVDSTLSREGVTRWAVSQLGVRMGRIGCAS